MRQKVLLRASHAGKVIDFTALSEWNDAKSRHMEPALDEARATFIALRSSLGKPWPHERGAHAPHPDGRRGSKGQQRKGEASDIKSAKGLRNIGR
ncbi:hypothetical protein SKAU_G00164050 [Synaphobranchus kaupii]|uniref:Uncharacterized protein n=1 Tax=Synaphobranchus kaupii TaxID=118154 RepID=A0A9Q1J015_SYNKA|nr:hypothetical protein SKAU_G00164050 [Synaphobranchus kaupii]